MAEKLGLNDGRPFQVMKEEEQKNAGNKTLIKPFRFFLSSAISDGTLFFPISRGEKNDRRRRLRDNNASRVVH